MTRVTHGVAGGPPHAMSLFLFGFIIFLPSARNVVRMFESFPNRSFNLARGGQNSVSEGLLQAGRKG